MFAKNNYIVTLNFWATKIELVVAEEIVNNNIRIVASFVRDYAGYYDGEFLEPDCIADLVVECYNEARETIGKRLNSLYIGVPAEFCSYVLKNLKINYKYKTVIKAKNIDELFSTINDNEISDEYAVVSKSPIYYVLDDGVQTIDPIDSLSKDLGAKASIVLAKNEFVELMTELVDKLKLKCLDYVPMPLAISATLLDESTKQSGAIVVDFGFISTSVTSFVGDGIVDMRTFAMGDGHIMSDLVEVLNLDVLSVEDLKKQIILTLEPNVMDVYLAKSRDGRDIKVSANSVNEVVKARLDSFGDIINNLLFSFQYKQDVSLPIYITGSGISYIKGAKNYLSKVLNRKCKILQPSQIEYANPKYSAKISLIKYVCDIY